MTSKSVESEFVALVNTHRGAVRRVVNTYAAAPSEREELFQEIVYQLWRAFPSFRHESSALTWVYRIAVNTAITAVRRQARQPEHVPLTSDHDDDTPTATTGAPDPRSELMYRAIRQLNDVDRAMVLCYLEGLSYERMAEVFGISRSNVGVRLNRAKARLHAIVRELEERPWS
jgi:RNA polymerase sigma factor (sigma-70 family)